MSGSKYIILVKPNLNRCLKQMGLIDVQNSVTLYLNAKSFKSSILRPRSSK